MQDQQYDAYKGLSVLLIILFIFISCSRAPEPTSVGSLSSPEQTSEAVSSTVNIVIERTILDISKGAISPDETYLACIFQQHPRILKLADLSVIYDSPTIFPIEKMYYGNIYWSGDGNAVIFSYYSLKERKGNTIIWNRNTRQDLTYPGMVRSNWADNGLKVIGYNIDPNSSDYKSICIVNVQNKQINTIPLQSLGFPQYYKIDNFNWWNGDTIIFTADIYSVPGKYDHTEMRTININTYNSLVLKLLPKSIDWFVICTTNRNRAFISSLPNNLFDVARLPGESALLNLDDANLEMKSINKKIVFHQFFPDGLRILCSLNRLGQGLVYGLYSCNSDTVLSLQDNSGKVIDSDMYGNVSVNYLLLQNSKNQQFYLYRVTRNR
ncbi:MAG: hypothetical protein ACE14V_02705 [bacterium]